MSLSVVSRWVWEKETLERAEARFKAGLGNLEGDVAQARVAYEGFRSTAHCGRRKSSAARRDLRNLLGISPADQRRLVPNTPLSLVRIAPNWPALQSLAEVHRPDLIELKLILEADEQELVLAKNRTSRNSMRLGSIVGTVSMAARPTERN